MKIYAVAITAQKNIPNGIETHVIAITFTCATEMQAKQEIVKAAQRIYPLNMYFNHRTSYCTVPQEAIDICEYGSI